MQQLAQDIHDQLKAAGGGSRQGHRPSAEPDFGVYSAEFNRIRNALRKRLKEQSAADVLALARALLAFKVYECRRIAYEVFEKNSAALALLNKSVVEELGRGLDNWASVDTFACSLSGAAWRIGSLSDATLLSWARSKDPWWRRVAIVSSVALNMKSRGGLGDAPRTLLIAEAVVGDSEPLMHKALAWALNCLVPQDASAVRAFMERHAATLPAIVKREVGKKLKA